MTVRKWNATLRLVKIVVDFGVLFNKGGFPNVVVSLSLIFLQRRVTRGPDINAGRRAAPRQEVT